jgi:citrate lyase subunit beta/citryl-CoA lyase
MRTRSYLYVPANDSNRLTKSLSRGADALIVDLEDGVAPADRFKSELTQCVPLLLDSAARLSKRMGYVAKKKV